MDSPGPFEGDTSCLIEAKVFPFDRDSPYLLSQDGLSDMASKERILTWLGTPVSIERKLPGLIAMALEAVGRDNITAVVLGMEKEPRGAIQKGKSSERPTVMVRGTKGSEPMSFLDAEARFRAIAPNHFIVRCFIVILLR